MNNAISITFGSPEHGWLPVDFRYSNFHINFDASDALNDQIKELSDVVNGSLDNQCRRITWHLEPAAYFFDIQRIEWTIILTIVETKYLHDENDNGRTLTTITADEKEIIEPFRAAVNQFYSQTYKGENWPYSLGNNKVGNS